MVPFAAPPSGFSDSAIVAAALVVVAGCILPWSLTASLTLGTGTFVGATVRLLRSAPDHRGSTVRRVATLALGVAITLAALAGWATRARNGLHAPSRSYDAVRAVVRTDAEPSLGGSRVDVSLDGHRWSAVVPSSMRGASLRVGDELVVSGSTVAFSIRRPFQDARHLAGRFRLRRLHVRHAGGVPYRQANASRSALLRSARGFTDTQRTLFAGFVLGDVTSARPELTDDFRASGLSHLVVVSGQNLAFLLAGVVPITSVIGRRNLWIPAILRLFVIVGFVFVVRFEPSVLRAAVMAAVMVVTRAIGRPQPLLRVLTLSVIVLLVVDPLLVRSVGFGLSIGAVGGIALIGPWLSEHLQSFGWLAGPLAVTIGAQLGTAPIALLIFDGVPVVSVLANVCAAVIAAPIMSWGVLAGLPAGLLGPSVSSVVHMPTRFLLGVVAALARGSASLPFGSWKLPDLAVVGVLGLVGLPFRKRAGRARRPLIIACAVLVFAMPMLRSTVTATKIELARTPQPFGRGAVVFGLRPDGLWRHVDVLVISHGVSAGVLLARLRASRIGAIDLVIVASGGKPQVAVIRAIHHRVDVGMAISAAGVGAPPGLRWKRALPGLAMRAGAVTVSVLEVRDRRVEVAVS